MRFHINWTKLRQYLQRVHLLWLDKVWNSIDLYAFGRVMMSSLPVQLQLAVYQQLHSWVGSYGAQTEKAQTYSEQCLSQLWGTERNSSAHIKMRCRVPEGCTILCAGNPALIDPHSCWKLHHMDSVTQTN
jgi:hypothetical protein